MINSQDIKKGTCIRLDGKLYFCVDFLHVKPGKGNTIMRTTLKDVVKGGQIERRFNIGEKLEDARGHHGAPSRVRGPLDRRQRQARPSRRGARLPLLDRHVSGMDDRERAAYAARHHKACRNAPAQPQARHDAGRLHRLDRD